MNKSLSIYLDAVRFVAALAVLLEHLSFNPITDGVISRPFSSYGSTAVTVFFLLSGYVIAYVVDARERSATSYFVSRVSRLYSVVLPALLITLLADYFGSRLHPDFYSSPSVLLKNPSLPGYLSSVFFVNEYQAIGLHGVVPGSNAPYWSLSFEATYYFLAGLLFFGRRWSGLLISLFVLCFAGWTIAALFPVWLGGLFLYRSKIGIRSPAVAWSISLLALGAVLMSPLVNHIASADQLGLKLPWGRAQLNRNIVGDYLAASAFAMHLVAMRSLPSICWLTGVRTERFVRWAGSLTFPMYLLHFPVACFFASISPWWRYKYAHAFFVLAATVIVVALVSPVCESLRVAFKSWLSNLAADERSYQARKQDASSSFFW